MSYNRRELVEACLSSIQRQTTRPARTIVVDNASTDGTAEHVVRKFPSVEIVSLAENRGPNPARNRVLRMAETDFVLLLDGDIVLEPDCLGYLLAVMRDPGVAVAAPLITSFRRPEEVQYGGCLIHYLGIGITRSGRIDRFRSGPEIARVTTVAGGAMLVRRSAASRVGLFDEAFFLGWEDGEFCARLTLAGYDCVQVQSALARHKGEGVRRARVYYQVRNRWWVLLELYSVRTLILIAPALLCYELALMALLATKRQLPSYARALIAVIGALPRVMRQRRGAQRLRSIPDRAWLTAGQIGTSQALVDDGGAGMLMRAGNHVLDLYWRLVEPLL